MDLTREALKYMVELGGAEVININGENYTDKQVYRVNQALRADPVKMSTLTSLLDYLKADVDTMPEKMIVQVESPTCVRALSRLDMDRKREELAVTRAELPDFDYGRYMGKEKFILTVDLKNKYEPSEEFLDWIEECNLDSIMKKDIQEFKDQLEENGITFNAVTTLKYDDIDKYIE